MTKTPEALLPCPFCGSKDVEQVDVQQDEPFREWAEVQCNWCGTTGKTFDFDVEADEEFQARRDAIAHWNTRAPAQPSGEAWRPIEPDAWFSELVILAEECKGKMFPLGLGMSRKVRWGYGADEIDTQHDLFVGGRFVTSESGPPTHYCNVTLPAAPRAEAGKPHKVEECVTYFAPEAGKGVDIVNNVPYKDDVQGN